MAVATLVAAFVGSPSAAAASTGDRRPAGGVFGAFGATRAVASPSLTDTDPNSPADDNAPRVKGTAPAATTVRLYTNPSCAGSPVATGTDADFASPGLAVAVTDNSSTTFSATATDIADEASPCSTSSITYVEDSTPPAVPTVTDTDPDSPADNNLPSVKGSAEAGSTVRLYTEAACAGAAVATGPAADFASPGLTVAVADNTSTTFRAIATDAAGHASGCSPSSIDYVERSAVVPPPAGPPAPPVTPPPPPPPAPSTGKAALRPDLTRVADRLRLSSSGRVELVLRCRSIGGGTLPSACTGRIGLTATIAGRKRSIGTAKFSFKPTATRTLKVRLTRTAREALGRRTPATLTMTVSNPGDPARASKSVLIDRDPPVVARAAERFPATDRRAVRAPARAFTALLATARKRGKVRAAVGLRVVFTPEGALTRKEIRAQRGRIIDARRALLRSLRRTRFEVVKAFVAVPDVMLTLSPKAVRALRASGKAAYVTPDRLLTLSLVDSAPLVGAVEARAVGRGGKGQTVVIMDTGVQRSHYFMQGRVPCPPMTACLPNSTATRIVAGACYTTGPWCPNGTDMEVSAGAGEPCTFVVLDCKHGTHVAGIAAGADHRLIAIGPGPPPPPTPNQGVAPDADIMPIQVGSKAICQGGVICANMHSFNVNQAMDHVRAEHVAGRHIASVNISFGLKTPRYPGTCDAVDPTLTNHVLTLRSYKIATVVASGNESDTSQIRWPACISYAVAVGATTKNDAVAGFSNSSAKVALLAPGEGFVTGGGITSSVPGNALANFRGTSMAAPHVAGAWAVMRQVDDDASVATILADLQATGKPVTGSARSRIRLLDASVRRGDTGFRGQLTSTGEGVDVASVGSGAPIAARTLTLPPLAIVSSAFLYWVTRGGPDNTATFQSPTFTGPTVIGTLIGASRGCPAAAPNVAFRTYRASLPTYAIGGPGPTTYTLGGVGPTVAGTVAGMGASLVVIYRRPGQPQAKVHLRAGAISVFDTSGEKSHDFAVSPPATPTVANLHVGVAGASAATAQVRLQLHAIDLASSPTNAYGPDWDDRNVPLPGLEVGPILANQTQVANTLLDGGVTCLAWAYSALGYH